MKRTKFNPTSKKRQALLPEYIALRDRLREGCNNKCELSGDLPNWESDFKVEPHHILGTDGGLLVDPFNIIMLTRPRHTVEQEHREGCHTKEGLLAIVKPIRIKQGY